MFSVPLCEKTITQAASGLEACSRDRGSTAMVFQAGGKITDLTYNTFTTEGSEEHREYPSVNSEFSSIAGGKRSAGKQLFHGNLCVLCVSV